MKNLLLAGLLTTTMLSSYSMASMAGKVSDEFKQELQQKVNPHHFFVEPLKVEKTEEKHLLKGTKERIDHALHTVNGVYKFCEDYIPNHTKLLISLLDQYTGMYSNQLKKTPVLIGDENVDLYTLFENSNTLITNFLTFAGLHQSSIGQITGESLNVVKEVMKILNFVKKTIPFKGITNPPVGGAETVTPDPLGDIRVAIPFTSIAKNFKSPNPSTLVTAVAPDTTASIIDPPIDGVVIATPVGTIEEPLPDTPKNLISSSNVNATTPSAEPAVQVSTPSILPDTISTNVIKNPIVTPIPVVTPNILENQTIINKIQAEFSALVHHLNQAAESPNKYQREIARDIKVALKKALKKFSKSMLRAS